MTDQNNQVLLSLCYKDINYHNLVIRKRTKKKTGLLRSFKFRSKKIIE